MTNDETTDKVNPTSPAPEEGHKRKPDAQAASRPANEATRAEETKPAATRDSASKADTAEAEALQAQIAELTDKLQRSVAEQENMRKRLEREKADFGRYAVANFARDVLSVADNIQRAMDAVPQDAAERDPALKSFLDGIEVTERELLKVMERYGISRLYPEGEKFDPNFHQAIFEVPTANVTPGTVVQVVQPGYMLDERVLRPAMVGVAKAAPSGSAENPGAGERYAQPVSSPEVPDPQSRSTEARTMSAPPPSDAPANETTAAPAQGPRAGSRLNEPVIGDTPSPRDRSRHG
jgi:molecular chaperone GrpE